MKKGLYYAALSLFMCVFLYKIGNASDLETPHFIQEQVCWVDETDGIAVLEIRAGGWNAEESVILQEVLSKYWMVDKSMIGEEIQVENLESGQERIQITLLNEEKYAGYMSRELPLLLREEYSDPQEDQRYPVVDSTKEGGLIWADQGGVEEIVRAEETALTVQAEKADLQVKILPETIYVQGKEETEVKIQLKNTGNQTLHQMKCILLYTDLNGKTEWIPTEKFLADQEGTTGMVETLQAGEVLDLAAKIMPSQNETQERKLLKVMVTALELKSGNLWEESAWVEAEKVPVEEQNQEETSAQIKQKEESNLENEDGTVKTDDKDQKENIERDWIIYIMAGVILINAILAVMIGISTKRKH